MGGFILQVLLIWFAYLLIPCSKRKGVPLFKYKSKETEKMENEAKKGCCGARRGGRLGCFMVMEFINTIISLGIFFAMVYPLDQKDSISIRGSVYFCKVLYGLLSFPFIFFALPFFTTLMTKTKATRYDK